ncbi:MULTISPECIES: CorA family divalent cation transporter [unclassified Bradyrhizobium]|uniref:CorA family divalent cation transporter n=1 Tax=Bradyrhizobium TaxID=374 RepID=UPI0028E7D8DB|nr:MULTISPECIES: CorA family divalent cation transporter [unclassified Bradyrhizobium]
MGADAARRDPALGIALRDLQPDILKMCADRAALAAVTVPPLEGLVWAFRFTADGAPQALGHDVPLHLDHEGWYWLHFNLADARALHWLANAEPSPAVRALLLSKETYQQLHGSDACVHGVIADLARDIGGSTEEAGLLRFAMTERLLISGRHQAPHAVDVTRRAIEGGQRVQSAAVLFEQIVENVAEAMERIIEYVMHPGGGRLNPNNPTQTRRIPDAIVFGLRTTTTF